MIVDLPGHITCVHVYACARIVCVIPLSYIRCKAIFEKLAAAQRKALQKDFKKRKKRNFSFQFYDRFLPYFFIACCVYTVLTR